MQNRKAHMMQRGGKQQLKTELYKYQKQGVRGIENFNGRALLADEMGLGKTIQAIVWAWRAKAFPSIVVCPASLKINWQREIRQHLGLNAEVLNGRKPHTNEQLMSGSRCRFTIINYDILGGWLEYLKGLNPQSIILDEIHAIKSPTVQKTKNCRKLCQGVGNVVALGGTPLVNRPTELWNVLNILRPDLFPTFTSFAMRYSRPKRTHWGWTYKGARNLPELNGLLTSNLMLRRRKADVLKELPAKIRIVIPLQIKNRDEYDAAADDIIAWLSKQSKARANKASRAKQLVRVGYLKRLAAELKLPAVCQWVDEFLDQQDGKLILFAVHKKIIKILADKYRGRCVVVDGSTRNRMNQVDKFQRSSRCRLFIGNIQAAGVGLNLTKAIAVAFAELPWTPGEVVQGEDRAHRIGQRGVVNVFFLVAENSIESRLCSIIQDKQAILDATLDGGKQKESLDVFDLLMRTLTKQRMK